MARVRQAAVAGSFYPSNPQELSQSIQQCLEASPLGPMGVRSPSQALVGGLVPHAGYTYSGPCASHLYARFDPSIARVILLGVNHQGRGYRAALSPAEFWQTPLGLVKTDQEFNGLLQSQVDFLRQDEIAHHSEHSIEVHLPFLQHMLGEFSFTPISLAHISIEECAELGAAVASVLGDTIGGKTRTIVLASSDLSHYLSSRETTRLDHLALDEVTALNPRALVEIAEQENITMCGLLPTAVLLFAANALGVKRADLLMHCDSGDVTPMRKVVGYASVALEL